MHNGLGTSVYMKKIGSNLSATSYQINQNLNYEKIYVFLDAKVQHLFLSAKYFRGKNSDSPYF